MNFSKNLFPCSFSLFSSSPPPTQLISSFETSALIPSRLQACRLPLPKPVYGLVQAATLTGQAEAGAKLVTVGWLQCAYGICPHLKRVYSRPRFTADINGHCPDELQAPGGCNNPFAVFKTNESCYNSDSCGPTSYSQFFKERCDDALVTLRMIKLAHLHARRVPITGLCSVLEVVRIRKERR
ncbi:Thaumatin family [Dillenia turbinata]|uniref:Thaumatin family n=1 Tax=Dillenia turbinata TaxID=194707 RepID=A0AAN8VSQ3_9MAGN